MAGPTKLLIAVDAGTVEKIDAMRGDLSRGQFVTKALQLQLASFEMLKRMDPELAKQAISAAFTTTEEA